MIRPLLLCVALFLSTPAVAGLTYPQDPVFNPLDPDETSPMQDMQVLADEGDARAQYILGDLYAKGKGGLPKNEKKAMQWFDTAARNGYREGLVRMGAIARRQGKTVEAIAWYTLAESLLSPGAWRTQAREAREALTQKASPEDIKAAREKTSWWRAEARKSKFAEPPPEKKPAKKKPAKETDKEKDAP